MPSSSIAEPPLHHVRRRGAGALVAVGLVVAVLGGCRSEAALDAQEADARVRTCVSLIERGAGWALSAESEIDDPPGFGADWQLLLDRPATYYGRILDTVTIARYLELTEQGRTIGTFRSTADEMKAGCPRSGS